MLKRPQGRFCYTYAMNPKIIKINAKNTAFNHLKALRDNRSKRHQEKRFFIEGVRSINNAIQYGWKIRGVAYSAQRDLSDWAKGVVTGLNGATQYQIEAELYDELSLKDESSELILIAETRKTSLDTIKLAKKDIVVVFDRSSSPGNLGSIIRTADALGIKAIILSGHGVDPYSPGVISAATGSFFAMSILMVDSPKQIEQWTHSLKKNLGSLQVFGTDEAGTPIAEANPNTSFGPTILLVGNETSGLSEAYKQMATQVIAIPMQGSASSLNAAVATSIILYELTRT
jgi:TrmH family RNA methyltransferase